MRNFWNGFARLVWLVLVFVVISGMVMYWTGGIKRAASALQATQLSGDVSAVMLLLIALTLAVWMVLEQR